MMDFEKWWASEGLQEFEAYCNKWGISCWFKERLSAKYIANMAWLSSETAAAQRVIDQIDPHEEIWK